MNAEPKIVEAHGETSPDHVKETDFDGHLTGEFEHKGENDERVAKASSKVTAGRHVSSKNGLEVAKERSKHVENNRKASAAVFDSDKLTVCPERKKGRK